MLAIAADYRLLLGDEKADLIFTDPPYNVPIDGHVCGLGRSAIASSPWRPARCRASSSPPSCSETLSTRRAVCRDGAIAFVCMDWRHMGELLAAGAGGFTELKNLCVWNKTNGGMGTFYRSKHELVFVFKVGTAPHTNSFGLGETGRYRTNVWDYAGSTACGATAPRSWRCIRPSSRSRWWPTPSRTARKRGEIVLDPFGGSGTTLIAAEKTRPARAADRVRPALLRHDHRALGAAHRQAGQLAAGRAELRGRPGRAQAGNPSERERMSKEPHKKPAGRTYEVGYGKPPVQGQFAKGKSGNPKQTEEKETVNASQPRASIGRRHQGSLPAFADRQVSGRGGDGDVQVTAEEAVLHSQLSAAVKGNSHAQKRLSSTVSIATRADEAAEIAAASRVLA